ncbi:MAG: NADH-quinone oxidoreductase subunit NuoH [Ignavibacteriae bacterium HGW-Ignavibacteriae-2]|jgi:NADH-quinone oxidoreductase subunit H|nr:NADH-quinone oxidoreductase subunit NuoH [Bacteroidota bacterium]PKL89963.1 MAG: NADH-quinone oxidoreductase subunit NuoH [Ignavibacteriae bacterium HGW-Ignavibacteriae-2]
MYNFLTELTGNEIIAAFISAMLPVVFIVPFVIFGVLAERKVSAHIQDRLGPMRVGYHGVLQTVADFFKLIQKEDIIAEGADRKFFNLAPYLVFVGSYAVYAALPFTSTYIGSETDIGLFYIIAVSGFAVAGILMGGWASNNKYSLYGALRSAAQIVSYEIPTALVILSMVMLTGTLSLATMSEMQTAYFWNWNIFGGAEWAFTKLLLIPFMFIAFIILYISTLAEVNRLPFDMPEAESELVAGYSTEYSGMKFAMFFLAEYGNMFAVSALVSVIFFGGYQSPFGYLGNSLGLQWLIPYEQLFWFALKGILFVLVQMWLRWTLPRVRVDQLMTICWKYLIPYSFANLIIIGLITLL